MVNLEIISPFIFLAATLDITPPPSSRSGTDMQEFRPPLEAKLAISWLEKSPYPKKLISTISTTTATVTLWPLWELKIPRKYKNTKIRIKYPYYTLLNWA